MSYARVQGTALPAVPHGLVICTGVLRIASFEQKRLRDHLLGS